MLSVLLGSQAFAQSSGANAATNVLKVSPVRSDIEIQPGETKTVKAYVTNLTDRPITVRPIANDFIAGDERGTPALILDADEFAPTHSLKRFMKPFKDVTIPAGKMQVVEVVVSVPKSAQAGGYFGAVRFAPADPDGGAQVNMSGSVASLMLLSVPGETVEKLTLTEFAIQQGGKSGTYFQSSNDLQATVRFESKSNVQVAPFGKLTVRSGDKVVYEYDFNSATSNRDMILPDSARRWDVPLKNIGSFGQYTVNATFTYGKKNQTVEVEQSFWVIPQMVIIIAIISAIVVVLLIVGIIFLIRKRSRRKSLRGSGGFRL